MFGWLKKRWIANQYLKMIGGNIAGFENLEKHGHCIMPNFQEGCRRILEEIEEFERLFPRRDITDEKMRIQKLIRPQEEVIKFVKEYVEQKTALLKIGKLSTDPSDLDNNLYGCYAHLRIWQGHLPELDLSDAIRVFSESIDLQYPPHSSDEITFEPMD